MQSIVSGASPNTESWANCDLLVLVSTILITAPRFGEALAEGVAQKEALIVLSVEALKVIVYLVLGCDRRKLVHLHVNDPLHIASFECVPRNLLRECWQLH